EEESKAGLIGELEPDDWDLPPKPKWMRWHTYNRYMERPARRPSLLVPARLSAVLCIATRHSNRSGASRTGKNQSAPHRRARPGRLGFATETEMEARAYGHSLYGTLRCV